MDRLILKAGTLVKVQGIPVELIYNTPVYGNEKNFVLEEEIEQGKTQSKYSSKNTG